MIDIVERLRAPGTTALDDEAADEIERLREALSRLLLEFDFLVESGLIRDCREDVIFAEARAALGENRA